MKESSWKECIESGNSRTITPDILRAESLIEVSADRIKSASAINGKNCNFVFEDYYTSTLELIQALALINGFKVSNHLCLGFFLRDFLKREDLFRIFDDLRYKRNMLTYYGKRMEFEVCREAINKCKDLIKKLKELLKR
ncbi:MAG: hypothetical protein J7K73_02640 [Nanoarchaeota archaeon]|nr:hypothetical protein [Nanoarchaeota archaeon]